MSKIKKNYTAHKVKGLNFNYIFNSITEYFTKKMRNIFNESLFELYKSIEDKMLEHICTNQSFIIQKLEFKCNSNCLQHLRTICIEPKT